MKSPKTRKLSWIIFSFLFCILCADPITVYGAAASEDADNNATAETAVALPMNTLMKGSLSKTSDTTDLYKFEVKQNGYVMITLTTNFSTPQFTLKDEKENYITSRYLYGSINEPATYNIIRQLTAGTYYIEADVSSSVGGDYSVYVTDQKPTAVKLSQTAITFEHDDAPDVQLKAEFLPKGSIIPEIKWESSDVHTASVYDGSVRATGSGYATITVAAKEFPNLKATCSVIVKPDAVTNLNQDIYKTTKKKLAVTCSAIYDADGYHFYRYDVNKGTYIFAGKAEDNAFTYSGLKQETGYKVKVCAYVKTPAGEIEGAFSPVKTFYTAPKTLKAPKITSIQKKQLIIYRGARCRVFRLKWKKVKGATYYRVYGQAKAGDKYQLMTTSKKPYADLYAGVGFVYKVYVVPVRTKHKVSTDGKKSKKYKIDMRE